MSKKRPGFEPSSGPEASILSVATAAPGYILDQSLARELAGALFGTALKDIERLLPIFDNTGIRQRHLSRPVEWFEQSHTFPEVNLVHDGVALELACEAVSKALSRAGLSPGEVDGLVYVCSTGIATPTLDSKLIQELGMPAETFRVPVFGLGCGGGVAGLARAADLARARPGGVIVLAAVELCSLTFQRGDLSKSNLVGTSLFGDGAAAVVIRTGQPGPAVVSSFSHLFDDSEGVMGWDLIESGFKVRFSKSIPGLVRANVSELVEGSLGRAGLEPAQLRHFVFHPGGVKVLGAYQEGLGLDRESLIEGYEILRDYGNMSSPSVLFVLERYLERREPSDDYGLMLALGPGFSAEQVIFRW